MWHSMKIPCSDLGKGGFAMVSSKIKKQNLVIRIAKDYVVGVFESEESFVFRVF